MSDHTVPPLSVLHVVTRNQRRGAEASAVELADRLSRLGQQSRVVALSPTGAGASLSAEVLGQSTLGPRTLWRLRQQLRHADVAVAHGSRTLPAVGIAGFGLRTPTVYQNIGDPHYWASSPLRRWRVRHLLARMSGVAALTESLATVLVGDFGVRADRVTVVPNWRDGEHFRPATTDERRAARRQLGLLPDQRVVAMVGALSVEKAVDLAVETVALLPGTQLLVAGDGPERGSLEALAAGTAPGQVRFLGALCDVRPLLRAADTFLLTSRSEGVPGVLIEAGLSGLPAVTTDVGFVRDVVLDGATGWVVPAPEPAALAAALREAERDGEARGRAARQHCLGRFDSRRVTDVWLSLLRTVAR